jgi:ribosomal protein S18 acetylase RimI-like enzyme
MSGTPSIHVFASHEWPIYRDLRLRALAESPDAFGSTLELERDRPDAEWLSRLAAGMDVRFHLPLVARLGSEPIGLAWGRIQDSDPDVANLYQLWVVPEFRRLGTGRLLLDAVIRWARRAGARRVELDVACGDSPAMRLYARAGFEAAGDPEPLRPGSALMKQAMRLRLFAERVGS